MRNFLLSIFLLCVTQYSFAQCASCTPNNFGCTVFGGLCNKADTGMANQPYSTVIHFYLPKKLTDPATIASCSNCSYVKLNHIKISGLTGLPAGVSQYTFNHTQAPWLGYYDVSLNDTLGCVTICGTPLAPGIYPIQVNLIADVVAIGTPIGDVDPGPQAKTYTDTIIVLPDTSGAVSSFTYGGVKEDCDSLRMTFNANPSFAAPYPNPTSYYWNFGNGNTSTLANPPVSQLYKTPGVYKVSLKITQYQYRVSKVFFIGVGSGWADLCDISCTGTPPDVYFTLPSLGFSNEANYKSSCSNILFDNLNVPIPVGTTSFPMSVFDDDNAVLCGADDPLGNHTININPNIYPLQVNFTNNSYGSVEMDTIVSTVFVDTLTVTIKGRPTKPVVTASSDSSCVGDSIRIAVTPYCANCSYEWTKDTAILAGITDSFFYTKVPGAYKAKVINQSTGCFSVSDTAKKVYFGAVPSSSLDVLYYAPDDQVFVQPGVQAGFKARWFKDGLEISGQTGTTIPFVGNGNYSVQIYNASFPKCTSESAPTLIEVSGISSINDLVQGVNIVPNPTQGKFKMVVFTLASEMNVHLNDLIGRELYSGKVTSANNVAEKEFDLSGAAKGIYLLNIEIGGKNIVRKIAVE